MEGLGGDRAGSCNPGVEAGLGSVGAVDAAAATAAAAAAATVTAGGLSVPRVLQDRVPGATFALGNVTILFIAIPPPLPLSRSPLARQRLPAAHGGRERGGAGGGAARSGGGRAEERRPR